MLLSYYLLNQVAKETQVPRVPAGLKVGLELDSTHPALCPGPVPGHPSPSVKRLSLGEISLLIRAGTTLCSRPRNRREGRQTYSPIQGGPEIETRMPRFFVQGAHHFACLSAPHFTRREGEGHRKGHGEGTRVEELKIGARSGDTRWRGRP